MHMLWQLLALWFAVGRCFPQAFRNEGELITAIQNWQYGFSSRDKVVAIYGTIADWDVSRITDMSNLFRNQDSFNEPIGAWNTSAVTNMGYMFYKADAFNQPIGDWDTSAVTSVRSMFSKASAFNQPIGAWNTSAVTDMSSMFYEASAFNQPIGAWNTSAVTNMEYMHRPNGQHHTARLPCRQPPAPRRPTICQFQISASPPRWTPSSVMATLY